ncbi:hypothetical protein M0Q97_01980 [Candidatus Dojkabacteria bacterium]|jgi:hypothetical protein|nr:hypothetical protein [Candidatus Dojkabacteria bacterium]
MDLDYKGFVERTESTRNDIKFIPKVRWNNINENNKIMDIVPGFPVNEKMKYDRNKMVQAIQNGMVILISYKGEKDSWKGGRERSIYPMVLGTNKNTKNELIRGFHLEGFSVSQKRETKKVWRLFKTANIKYMMFTGHFYRLPPKGYKLNDRVMTENTISRADFNTIRRNQEALIKAGKIEQEENVKIQTQGQVTTSNISIKNTGTVLNLKNPWINETIASSKKIPKDVKISILKTVFSNEYIAIVGALGEVGRTVKVYEEKKLLGSYKTIASFTGDVFNKYRQVNNVDEFDLYSFIKKI